MPGQQNIIPISSVISVGVEFLSSGIPGYNVNNIGLFTTDAFITNPNNDLYRIYINSYSVGQDFGTSTETYLQAVNVFAQQPNILNGNGVLVIVPMQGGAIAGATVGSSAGTGYVQGDILNITSSTGIGGQIKVTTIGGYGAITGISILTPGVLYTATANQATTGGTGTAATITVSSIAQETMTNALLRANSYLYFNGILSTNYGANSTWAALAAVVQSSSIPQMLFLPSSALTDINNTFTDIFLATDYYTRCLYYGGTAQQARLFAAAYASKLLSVNWTGSNVCITMNLQQLQNVDPDTTLSTTLLSELTTAGVDAYGNYGGSYPGVVCNGANKYADEISNLVWLVTSLQVAGFDALATVGTKVPQTESGMQLLKGAYRLVLNQAVSNGYLAPGQWTSLDTFGDQTKFLANITQYGFYIYSEPVSLQSIQDRAARKAPLVQIACKEAGAIQESSVLITINQ